MSEHDDDARDEARHHHHYVTGDRNGSTGGDFLFRVNVVPGDVDGNTRVLSADTTFLRGRLGVGSNGATYSVFADLNGSGIIDSTDLSLVNARLGQQLPVANPVAPIF